MARYWRVSPKFWSDPKVAAWDDDTKVLALYVLTNPHRTAEGLFRLPKSYIVADLKWTLRRLAKPFARLVEDGFIAYDEQPEVCLIPKALDYQSPQNANQVIAAVRAVQELPPTVLAPTFRDLAEQFSERLAKELPEGFGNALALAPTQAPAPPPVAPAASGPEPFALATMEAPPPATRRSDPLWDALVQELGYEPDTESARGSWNGAIKQLRQADATADEVGQRCWEYRRRHPGISLTPPALAKHWAALGAPSTAGATQGRGRSVVDAFARRTAGQ